MTQKKQQLLDYLDTNLFIPIMCSPSASFQLKNDFEHTRELIKDFSASGILCYIWTMLSNNEMKVLLNNRLLDEGLGDYTHILNDFNNEFTYDWLMS